MYTCSVYIIFLSRGTFFVEYHFPRAAGRASQRPGGSEGRGGVRLFPSPTEVVRVASKKIKNGGQGFLGNVFRGSKQMFREIEGGCRLGLKLMCFTANLLIS